ncbi:MAG: tRNA 4-thiouridine(8) synthase ThiI [Spirochaetes bacterium]|nr:tRNA 4-thiouridine(8) synthase ThiI [Spirochaetota bacterium]
MKKQGRYKALALLSGGLDSILAIRLIQDQGIDVQAVTFVSPFFNDRKAREAARALHVKVITIDITDKIIKTLEKPKYGFGKNLNPCIDCHLLMVRETVALLKKLRADFIITGEVVGERPKSQNYQALKTIETESGIKGKLLRPLSAKRLDPTEMELKGIVKRDKLEGITGKSRTRQIELAGKLGIKTYPAPAGGCLLTVPRFADRLRENLRRGLLKNKELEMLKYGRHFLTGKNNRVIIGRWEDENSIIFDLADDLFYIMDLKEAPGPVTVLETSEPDNDEILKVASLTARYSKSRNKKKVLIRYYQKKDPAREREVEVRPRDFKTVGFTLL